MREPLFRRLAGPAFEQLPLMIREIHTGARYASFSGACTIDRGQHWLARLIAMIAGMPSATAQVALRVEIEADEAGETWTRHFGACVLRSELQMRNGLLVERLGPMAIAFQVEAYSDMLHWLPQGGRVLGIPFPARFFKGISAVESLSNGCYGFNVRASLPLIGLIVHYRGWLQPDG